MYKFQVISERYMLEFDNINSYQIKKRNLEKKLIAQRRIYHKSQVTHMQRGVQL
jgi:hypothetical protein